MAEDFNKKIKIEAELEIGKAEKSITSLNKLIDTLFLKQQMLTAAGLQTSTAYENVTAKLELFQKKLKDVTTQVTENTKSLKDFTTAAKGVDGSLSSSATSNQKSSAAINDNSAKIKVLSTDLKNLDVSVKQQITNIDKSKSVTENYDNSIVNLTVNLQQLNTNISQTNNVFNEQGEAVGKNKEKFDAHKLTMDHLKKSFDEIKDVSGEFGPSLAEASKGFGVMQSGLKLVQDGFKGVGAAIKADGFEFLLEILQYVFDAFVKSSNGSKILKGAISAIGVIVKDVSDFFHSLMDGIINAFSHPVESIKALGKMIMENIINRFKAFSVILDGIIHLDFKKMADGAIQAVTGVTNATDKIVKATEAVVNSVKKTAGEVTDAFKKGYANAGKEVENHEKKVVQSNGRIIKSHKAVQEALKAANQADNNKRDQCGCDDENDPITATGKKDVKITGTNLSEPPSLGNVKNLVEKTKVDEEVKIKKTGLQQVEDYAKKSGAKMATDALQTLKDSIKQQAEAKIAALEKNKAAELSNSSLTSAQKLAIENKYKKQEAAIKLKAFKAEQKASIAQAIINGAIAITKAPADLGPVGGAIAIGVIIASTALQVATIAKQHPPAMAKGGYFKSDGKGAILPGYSRTDNTNAYLRSGEAVVVSEAMQVPWARNLVSAINVGFGGRDFSVSSTGRGYAVGGIFTDGGNANRYYNQPVNDQKNLANTIAYQMINNFPPVYVDVKDVNNQQNILAQTINRVNL